jgi:rod shape determining protein RodA
MPLRHLDIVLVASAIATAVTGVVFVYSATRSRLATAGIDPQLFLKRQAVWVVIGVIAMIATLAIDYARVLDFAPLLFGGLVLALVAVLTPVGTSAHGAQRWFSLGTFQLQPATFATVGLVVVLAAVLKRANFDLSAHAARLPVGLAVVAIALVAAEPDLGTALVLGVITLGILMVAGVPARHMAFLLTVAALAVVTVASLGLLKHYQTQRLTAFLDQSRGSRGVTYNLEQSKIAIAAGGLKGKGLFEGSQTNLSYVPEQHTDFIFTAVGEQLGLLGSSAVLGLFGLLAWRAWRTALLARDDTGRLLCVGILAMLAFQVFENTGMTMGIMPVTGIPLPLMSYGGSSTLVGFVAVGLVGNVHMRRFS